jgi:hypothetical protein
MALAPPQNMQRVRTKVNTAKAACAEGAEKVEVSELIGALWPVDVGWQVWVEGIGRINRIDTVATLAPVAL